MPSFYIAPPLFSYLLVDGIEVRRERSVVGDLHPFDAIETKQTGQTRYGVAGEYVPGGHFDQQAVRLDEAGGPPTVAIEVVKSQAEVGRKRALEGGEDLGRGSPRYRAGDLEALGRT